MSTMYFKCAVIAYRRQPTGAKWTAQWFRYFPGVNSHLHAIWRSRGIDRELLIDPLPPGEILYTINF